MVKICTEGYTNKDESIIKHFNCFPFPLSDFQKYAIEAITTGNDILITAHTGSGKTLPAEFAIRYFTQIGKKVIYTSPIKALSNQKFHEFSQKFPDISFGILTGDIKYNPEAQVTIMTTEILRNSLLNNKYKREEEVVNIKDTNDNGISNNLLFTIDFQNIACVVFDEVHYINDADRGKVWEESIMFMPQEIQLIMLSATIDKPDIFASWIENIKHSNHSSSSTVYLAPTSHRVVPLYHYLYLDINIGTCTKIKDKVMVSNMNRFCNKLLTLKDKKVPFDDSIYDSVSNIKRFMDKENIRISSTATLNNITKYLYDNDMLPAICFIFSRVQVERYANAIHVLPGNVIDKDGNAFNIQKDCEAILRKLPNHAEYSQLPEFHNIVRLLEKGIAYHHSGIIPVFREMIEILFGQGKVKLLFATETFAVGINMPTKTVLFSGFQKFNGASLRTIFSHEYTQMAGRAGRRGLDTVGHVIHLTNMTSLPYKHDYKNMMNGKPQLLTSKFCISYNLVLNFISNRADNNDTEAPKDYDQIIDQLILFSNDSFCQSQNSSHISSLKNELDANNNKAELLKVSLDPHKQLIEEYNKLQDEISNTKKAKKRKDMEKRMNEIKSSTRMFDHIMKSWKQLESTSNEIEEIQREILAYMEFFETQTNKFIALLSHFDFISKMEDEEKFTISEKGIHASHIQEVHCLCLADILCSTNIFEDFTENDIVAYLSIFCDIKIKDDIRITSPDSITFENKKVYDAIILTSTKLNEYTDYATSLQLYQNVKEEKLCYDLIESVYQWCEASTEEECRGILFTLQNNYDVFSGEFIKSILKINNVTSELTKVCESSQLVSLQHKLSKISGLTLKFIATNQSLYL